MTQDSVTPEVLWAQRSSAIDASKNIIFLTISVPDVPSSNLKLDIKPKSLVFTGHSETLKKTYHLELEFYAEIDDQETHVSHTAKNVEIKLRKKELNEAYWPRLLQDSKKVHYLKTDFDKWVDEEDQNTTAEDEFSDFGGMAGMPDMGGGDFSGMDFSKLGGAGAGGDLGGVDDEADLSDEDDMPELENADDEEAKEENKEDAKAQASEEPGKGKEKELPGK